MSGFIPKKTQNTGFTDEGNFQIKKDNRATEFTARSTTEEEEGKGQKKVTWNWFTSRPPNTNWATTRNAKTATDSFSLLSHTHLQPIKRDDPTGSRKEDVTRLVEWK